MDDSRLKKIGAELKKARARRDEWDAKVKELERKYREAENTCIHTMVHAANLSPEQLAALIEMSRKTAPAGDPRSILEQNEEDAEG
jgi:F0F1-type ATP synthase membrane subunit b/b'